VHRCRAHLAELHATLKSVDPAAVLARGYSITYDAAGHVLRSPAAVRVGERIATTLAKGRIESEVKKI
jgi:exodeoxyribonuclease VII large subunit